MSKILATITFIWGIIEAIHEFTNWLNHYGTIIIISYFSIMIFAYISGILYHSYSLLKEVEDLTNNRNGLENQHKIDLNDKRNLYQTIRIDKSIIEYLTTEIPKEKLVEVNTRIGILKEIFKIGKSNESSKNNKY